MVPQLSEGALGTIMQGGDFNEPVVQVLSVKKMNTSSGQPEKDRYRAYLSDGKYTVSFAMMTAPVYAKAGQKGLPKYSIIRISRFITSVINNTDGKDSRVLLILDLEVLADGDDVAKKIGDPEAYTEAGQGSKSNGTSHTNGTSNNTRNNMSHDGPAAKVPKLSSMNASTSNDPGNTTLRGHVTHPISSLSPYHNKWIIKARVTNKSTIRTWSNSRGEGQLFSMELVDESGEIRCTAFREQVDKFYNLIQVDKVYYISKCQLKTANKQFCNLKNDYEMTMASETIIEECADEESTNIPQTTYNFVPISRIADLEPNTIIDVLAVVKAAGEVQCFQAKSGRDLRKKELQLIDQSNTTVTLTLWGSEADTFPTSENPIIALKGARIGEFGGGKTLSTISGTSFRVNPDLPEGFQLKGWYDREGSKEANATDLSARTGMGGSFNTPWMSFKEVADQQYGSINTEKGDYYQIKGTILLLRSENATYKACATADCNKKVIDQGNGMYRCEKCNREFENFKFRLLCSMNVGDWSGNQWISMFSDEAEKVVGITAKQAGELQENDPTSFNETMEKVHFKQFILKCRAKMETYNDEQRLKTVAVRVEPINHEEFNKHLIETIQTTLGV